MFQFQFHEGSINTEDLLTDETTALKFQFHEGSINTRYIQSPSELLAISIP